MKSCMGDMVSFDTAIDDLYNDVYIYGLKSIGIYFIFGIIS